MKTYTDITKIDFYLQGMGGLGTKPAISKKDQQKKNFKILVKDDVKNSMYLVDA